MGCSNDITALCHWLFSSTSMSACVLFLTLKACELKQTDVVYQCVDQDCGFLSDRWTVTEGAWVRQGWTRGTKAPTQLIVSTCQRSKSQRTMATEHKRTQNGQWKLYFSSYTLADLATVPFHDDLFRGLVTFLRDRLKKRPSASGRF